MSGLEGGVLSILRVWNISRYILGRKMWCCHHWQFEILVWYYV